MLARLLPSFLLYTLVGAVGFAVDGGVMTALHGLLDWSPIAARALSFPAAVTATWLLNRHWTFGRGGVLTPRRRYGLYALVQVMGAAINLGIFAVLVEQNVLLEKYPIVALAVAAVPALAFTYTTSKLLVFRQAALMPTNATDGKVPG